MRGDDVEVGDRPGRGRRPRRARLAHRAAQLHAGLGGKPACRRQAGVRDLDVERLGPLIECHDALPRPHQRPARTRLGPTRPRGRVVWERGVGATRSSGSSAVAAAAAAVANGWCESPVTVSLPAGKLRVELDDEFGARLDRTSRGTVRGEAPRNDDLRADRLARPRLAGRRPRQGLLRCRARPWRRRPGATASGRPWVSVGGREQGCTAGRMRRPTGPVTSGSRPWRDAARSGGGGAVQRPSTEIPGAAVAIAADSAGAVFRSSRTKRGRLVGRGTRSPGTSLYAPTSTARAGLLRTVFALASQSRPQRARHGAEAG